MVSSRDREMYRLVRYDYYHAGRLLYEVGNFHSAGIMLGYTIETTLKAGLLEVLPKDQQNDRLLTSSHDVRKIFRKCKSLNLFDDVQTSDDFLEQINSYFQRYPSQINQAVENAKKSNFVIANSADWEYFYDDLIVQLDWWLLCKTRDPMISMIYHAIRTLETRQAQDILNKNPIAILKFDEYAAIVQQNMPEREDLRQLVVNNLSKGANYYWNPRAKLPISHEQITEVSKKYSSRNFQLVREKIVNDCVEIVIP